MMFGGRAASAAAARAMFVAARLRMTVTRVVRWVDRISAGCCKRNVERCGASSSAPDPLPVGRIERPIVGGASILTEHGIAARKTEKGMVLHFREHGTFFGHRGPRTCRSVRELGSFCAIVISVAPGCTPLRCTRLHGVRVRLSKTSRRLRLRGSTRVRGLQRVGPRSRKRQDARKTARLYYPPIVRDRDNNRARRIRESREKPH